MPGSADETAAYRPLLFSIAYGMTGSVGDAEFMLREVFGYGYPDVARINGRAARHARARRGAARGRRRQDAGDREAAGRAAACHAHARQPAPAGQGPRRFPPAGRVVSVIEPDTGPNGHGSDVVQAMHAVVNPDKLVHLRPVSDVARLPGSRPAPGGSAADGGA